MRKRIENPPLLSFRINPKEDDRFKKINKESENFVFYEIREEIDIEGRRITSGHILKESKNTNGRRLNQKNYMDIQGALNEGVDDYKFEDKDEHVYPRSVVAYSVDYKYAILDKLE